MLTLPTIRDAPPQTDSDVSRIFALAGIVVRQGAFYDATSGQVVEIDKVQYELDWMDNAIEEGR